MAISRAQIDLTIPNILENSSSLLRPAFVDCSVQTDKEGSPLFINDTSLASISQLGTTHMSRNQRFWSRSNDRSVDSSIQVFD